MGDVHFPVLFIAGAVFILLFVVGFVGMKIRIPAVVLYILLGIGLGGHFSGNHLLPVTANHAAKTIHNIVRYRT